MIDIYINSACTISPQNTFYKKEFLKDIVRYKGHLTCIEPDYREYLPSIPLRRMSHILKMGVTSAQQCLKEGEVEQPDAINIGTGLGCVYNTEKFLNKMLDNNEALLSPTDFIQSTHNIIGSQIAMMLNCNSHNVTYVHKNISFESALEVSMSIINTGQISNALVGGVDEFSKENYLLKKNIGLWKDDSLENVNLLDKKDKGTIPGEASSFFLISNRKTNNSYCKILASNHFYKIDNLDEIKNKINMILKSKKMTIEDIDLIVFGHNGDVDHDKPFYELMDNYFTNQIHTYYKHLCGEYDTSTGFAMWLAAMILKNNEVPETIRLNDKKKDSIKNILIYHQDYKINHSLILLSKC